MFRFIRWMCYLTLGYMLYEMIRASQESPRRHQSGGESGSDASLRQGVGTMTGPGQGQRVQTEDADGAAVSHVVGRGVVT